MQFFRRVLNNTLLAWSISLAATYFLLAPAVAAPLYNHLLFFPNYPTRYDEASYKIAELQGVPKEDVYISSSDGRKLHAWLFRRADSKRIAVVDHGNASNISYRVELADDLLKLGVSVLMFDYQGYGRSEGSPSVKNICDDGLAAFDYTRDKLGYQETDIILYGESLGCAVACDTSSHRKCAALILQSGFSSLKEAAADHFIIFRAYPSVLFPKPSLDNLAILKQQHPPLLLVHGQFDGTISVAHAELVYKLAADPKSLIILPNSGHYVAEDDHLLYMSALKKFLASLETPAAQMSSR